MKLPHGRSPDQQAVQGCAGQMKWGDARNFMSFFSALLAWLLNLAATCDRCFCGSRSPRIYFTVCGELSACLLLFGFLSRVSGSGWPRTHRVAQVGLKLVGIFLSRLPECWQDGHALVAWRPGVWWVPDKCAPSRADRRPEWPQRCCLREPGVGTPGGLINLGDHWAPTRPPPSCRARRGGAGRGRLRAGCSLVPSELGQAGGQ